MGNELETSHDISDILARINALPDANSGDPIADSFTWEDAGQDHPAASIPMPGETAAAPTQGTPIRTATGGKVSVGSTGITDAGLAKAEHIYAGRDKAISGFEAQDAARTADEQAKSRAGYAGVGQAIGGEIDATKDFEQQDRDLSREMMDFQQGAAALEQRLAGEAQAERATYLTGYKEQLAVVKQLAMQSGNPMMQLSKPEAIGLAGAQFAQGFLAAQGIQIDVAGQVDRWVDRSIQEHQMKIQNARASADDQLHLYELARQNSQDEWEARQRYRGFVIAGLQTAIDFNARRFQSDIAMARAGQQIARLQVEADNTERSIGDAHYARVKGFMDSQFDRAYKMGMLAKEQKKIDLEGRKQDWEESDKNPKNLKAGKGADLWPVTDPENPQGPARWAIRFDDKDAMEKGRDARAYTQSVYKQLANLEAARAAAYKAYGGAPWISKAAGLTSPEIREYERQRDATIMTIRQATTGKAFTKEETEEYKKMLPDEHGWQAGNNDKAIAQLKEKLRGDFEAKMDTYSAAGGGQTASPQTAAQNDAALHGAPPQRGFADAEAGKVLARESEHVATQKISGAWADFTRDQLSKDPSADIKLGQPEYAVAIDHLAMAVARPRYFNTHAAAFGAQAEKNETPDEIRAQSYKAIVDIASGNTSATGPMVQYAQHVRDGIDADPVLSKQLAEPDTDKYGLPTDVEDSPFIKRLAWRPGQKD